METEPTQPIPEEPRRLTRSTEDRVLAGVCGGIARRYGIDVAIVRVATVVLALAVGFGVIAYLAAVLLVPGEDGPADAKPDRTAGLIVLGLLLFFAWPLVLGGGLLMAGLALPVAVLALFGLVAWWLATGHGPDGEPGEVVRWSALGAGLLILCAALFTAGATAAAFGGGTVAAAVAIGAGAVLVVSAFFGGARLLVLPAMSLALAAGIVAAAGVDINGGVGERDYRPESAADIRDAYELGLGELTLDLRGVELPAGDTPVAVDLGVGELRVLVDEDVCVATRAKVGAGVVNVFDRLTEGVDVDVDDRPKAVPGRSRLLLDADLGMGEVRVNDGSPRFDRYEHHNDHGADTHSEPQPGCEARASTG